MDSTLNKYCVRDYNSDESSFLHYAAHLFKCQQPLTGQYVLIRMNDKLNKRSSHKFEFSELYIYGKKTYPLDSKS